MGSFADTIIVAGFVAPIIAFAAVVALGFAIVGLKRFERWVVRYTERP